MRILICICSFVQTEMGNAGARKFGMEKAFTEVNDCVSGLVSIIDGATKEKTSGHFCSCDGGELIW
jgi:norsolorinic acid ketoreductase